MTYTITKTYVDGKTEYTVRQGSRIVYQGFNVNKVSRYGSFNDSSANVAMEQHINNPWRGVPSNHNQ